MKLGIIGGGVMAEAIVRSVLEKGVYGTDDITVGDVDRKRCDYLAKTYKIKCHADNKKVVSGADMVLLAVKPQVAEEVVTGVAGVLKQTQPLMSIMAGINIRLIGRLTHHTAIVRVMPNTPAQIGEGMSVWTATMDVKEPARQAVKAILAALGREVFVKDEKYLDMATAVSGSGPAYVFLFLEAMVDAAVHLGISRDLATEMVLQTISGSVALVRKTGQHPAALRNSVTSPGGTTAEALKELEAGNFRAVVDAAVVAAYNKARSLGG